MAWNRGEAKPVTAERKPRVALHGAIAAAVIVVGAVAAWLALSRDAPKAAQEAEPSAPKGLIAEATPAAAKAEVAAKPQEPPKEKEEPKVPPGHEVITNGGHVIVMTHEEAESFRRACRDTTLRTRTEKHLRQLATIPMGMPIPPMPDMIGAEMDKDIADTLHNKIEILPDDTEREIEQKEFVMAFKEYLREEIKNGKKPSEVYREYVKMMNDVAYLTTEGARQARELRANGDEAGAQKFVDLVNKRIQDLSGEPGTVDINRRGPRGRQAAEGRAPADDLKAGNDNQQRKD